MKKTIFWSSFTLVFVVFLTILYKAITQPITHDEVATVIHYYNFSVWEIMMYPDNWPNNHILNTLSAKFFINIFGKETWVIRIPNLISYWIYVFASYRIIRLFFSKNSLFVLPAILLFLFNVYLNDFFGLCRGYGMAVSLITLSVSYLLEGFSTRKDKFIWLAVLFSILASYANFTSLIFWAGTMILVGFYFINKYSSALKSIGINLFYLILISVAYLSLIIVPLRKMTSTNQFKYWHSKGFYKDTIISLIDTWKTSDRMLDLDINIFAGIFISLFFLGFIIMMKKIGSKDVYYTTLKAPFLISWLILAITIFVNLAQVYLMGTPNLTGRTALLYYPMYVTVIIGIIAIVDRLMSKKWLNYSLAILISIFAIVHFLKSWESDSVREWWYEKNNLEVIDYINEHNNSEDRIKLKVQWWFYPSFHYYNYTGKIPQIELLPNKNGDIDTDTEAEYYYIMDSEKAQLEPKFEVAKRFKWNRWLMKRKER